MYATIGYTMSQPTLGKKKIVLLALSKFYALKLCERSVVLSIMSLSIRQAKRSECSTMQKL